MAILSSETDCITAETSGMFISIALLSPFLKRTTGVLSVTFAGIQSAEE